MINMMKIIEMLLNVVHPVESSKTYNNGAWQAS